MNKGRMTIWQLLHAINEEDRVFISSIYNISAEVELTKELRSYTGILTLDIFTLLHNDEGYVAIVDLPAAAIAALDKPE